MEYILDEFLKVRKNKTCLQYVLDVSWTHPTPI